MSKTVFTACLIPFISISIVYLVIAITTHFRNKSRYMAIKFIQLNGLIFIYQLSELVFYITNNTFFSMFSTAVLFLLAPASLYLILGFYRMDRSGERKIPIIIFVLPLVAILAVLLPFSRPYFISYILIYYSSFTDLALVAPGALYYISAAFAVIISIVGLVITIKQHRKIPSSYNGASLQFASGMTILYIAVAVKAIFINQLPLSAVFFIVSIASVFIFYGSATNKQDDYFQVTERNILNYLDVIVLITDKAGYILEMNTLAKSFFEGLSVKTEYISFDKILNTLQKEGKILIKTGEDMTEDLYVLQNPPPIIYNMRRQKMINHNGEEFGGAVTLTDVTLNRMFIERLRTSAGTDTLTGLPNRRRYAELIRKLDVPENLPFSVLVGDANRLKTVNDRYGHEAGDLLLTKIAEVLKNNCPENCYAARIGGDEFVMLMPKTDEDKALKTIRAIQSDLAEIKDLSFDLSMAIGWATKYIEDQNLNHLISEADTRMYDQKK